MIKPVASPQDGPLPTRTAHMPTHYRRIALLADMANTSRPERNEDRSNQQETGQQGNRQQNEGRNVTGAEGSQTGQSGQQEHDREGQESGVTGSQEGIPGREGMTGEEE